jgi:sugar phosphate isomerase/epimerase
MHSICLIARSFIGDSDANKRAEAMSIMFSLLDVASEIGARGAITPAAFGVHSNVLPSSDGPRDVSKDRAMIVDALGKLGEHATARGVTVWFEPLNRYEDHIANTLAQASDIARATGLASVKILADLFHMNIEEADLARAIRKAGEFIDHVHLADSSRLEPGTGHTDFAAVFAALGEIGFAGTCALECGLSTAPETALAAAMTHLRAAGA